MTTTSRPVLVAYASRHGSTQDVAEVIGDVLREHGAEADVRPAAEVCDLAPYGGVVLGAAVIGIPCSNPVPVA